MLSTLSAAAAAAATVIPWPVVAGILVDVAFAVVGVLL
jgi:hypothetical protein